MSTPTKEAFAALLSGREMGDEITFPETRIARDAGLVILFGASDDLIEVRGAFGTDEFGAYQGTILYAHKAGFLPDTDQEECKKRKARIVSDQAKCVVITCAWDRDGYSWHLSSDRPYAPFDIMEDGEKYCRGIVIRVSDLPVI